MSLVLTGTYTSGFVLNGSYANPVTVVAGATVATANRYAIYGRYGFAWTITNQGLLSGASFGVTLGGGGTIINKGGTSAGSISGGIAAISISGTPGYVSNLGTVTGTKTHSVGVWLGAGGAVVNGSTAAGGGLITAYYVGVDISGAPGSVVNAGTIQSTTNGGFGIRLQAGGTVANLAGAAGPGMIRGTTGVAIYGGTGSVSNYGTITSTGAYGTYGVKLTGAGTITNGGRKSATGVIAGGVQLVSGSVGNYGTITGLALHHRGIYATGVSGSISVTNSGVVDGTEAVRAAGFLRLTNGSTTNTQALLNGRDFGVMAGAGAAVLNSGTITSALGALLFAAGTQTIHVTNGSTADGVASITGSQAGVYMQFYGSASAAGQMLLTNFGTITGGTEAGVVMSAQGGGLTLINAGTITDMIRKKPGIAVDFLNGNAVLAVEPSSVFVGKVLANASDSNILDFTSAAVAGTVTGIGTEFVGFQNIWLDPLAQWSIAGQNTLAAASGITLHGQSTVTITGTLGVGGSMSLQGTGVMAVGSSGTLEVGTAGHAAAGVVTVDAGDTLAGFGTVGSAIVDNGAVEASGGTLALAAAVSGSGIAEINASSVLLEQGPLAAAQIDFLAGAGTLQLAPGVAPAAPIANFGAYAGNGIELLGTQGTALNYTSLSSSSGVLSVSEVGGAHVSLYFASGSYTTSRFHLSHAAGGTATMITFS